MTYKTLMISAATAALLATSGYAQDAETDTEAEAPAAEAEMDTQMAEGEDAMAAEGEDTEMAEGEDAMAAEGDDTEMAEGEDAMAAEGDDTEMAEGEDAMAAEGDDTEMAEGEDAMAPEGDDTDMAEGDATAEPMAEDGAETDMAEGEAADPMATDGGDMAATDPAMGTDTMTGDDMAAVAPTFTSFEEMTVGDVVGLIVRNEADERVGEIDYVIQPAEGVEAVIGIGGFLGLGEYTVALPLEDFELVDGGTSLMLPGATKESLKENPEFDESGVEGIENDVPIAELM
ncbi:hypothetical protein [Pelagovum pacificum]|uniref:PRC-barrel domain-containing protein n=1 Tax=Pelagovum pacificum TaxID=2588711 RepID=A0A5C5GHB6_9RHOB|nr:hypothetical protein [Pelagovum pacificum]QQA42746.1 hypothetical protein I8N54_18555 [Pelagovum pacificum]TNY34103.1 hypothetical protein FHY64_12825 [Pelagovum pacificum]